MVDKAKNLIPDFVKEGIKNVREPLGKIEHAVIKVRDQLSENIEKIDTSEIRNVMDDVLGRVRTAQGELEKFFAASLVKTYAALNLPTRKDVEGIKKELNSLSKAVNELKKGKKASAKKAGKKK